MKGYVVCVYKSIGSEEKLKEYATKAKAAVEKYEEIRVEDLKKGQK